MHCLNKRNYVIYFKGLQFSKKNQPVEQLLVQNDANMCRTACVIGVFKKVNFYRRKHMKHTFYVFVKAHYGGQLFIVKAETSNMQLVCTSDCVYFVAQPLLIM